MVDGHSHVFGQGGGTFFFPLVEDKSCWEKFALGGPAKDFSFSINSHRECKIQHYSPDHCYGNSQLNKRSKQRVHLHVLLSPTDE